MAKIIDRSLFPVYQKLDRGGLVVIVLPFLMVQKLFPRFCGWRDIHFLWFRNFRRFQTLFSDLVDGMNQLSSTCVAKLWQSNSAAVDKMARILFVVIKIEAGIRFRILLVMFSAILGSTVWQCLVGGVDFPVVCFLVVGYFLDCCIGRYNSFLKRNATRRWSNLSAAKYSIL